MSTKLYVGNISYQTTEADLHELFSQAGTVEAVNVITDRATGRPRGFAFVEMSNEADAESAIAQFNSKPLGGRNLTVNKARPQAPRSGGFGGGNRGGHRSEPRW